MRFRKTYKKKGMNKHRRTKRNISHSKTKRNYKKGRNTRRRKYNYGGLQANQEERQRHLENVIFKHKWYTAVHDINSKFVPFLENNTDYLYNITLFNEKDQIIKQMNELIQQRITNTLSPKDISNIDHQLNRLLSKLKILSTSLKRKPKTLSKVEQTIRDTAFKEMQKRNDVLVEDRKKLEPKEFEYKVFHNPVPKSFKNQTNVFKYKEYIPEEPKKLIINKNKETALIARLNQPVSSNRKALLIKTFTSKPKPKPKPKKKINTSEGRVKNLQQQNKEDEAKEKQLYLTLIQQQKQNFKNSNSKQQNSNTDDVSISSARIKNIFNPNSNKRIPFAILETGDKGKDDYEEDFEEEDFEEED